MNIENWRKDSEIDNFFKKLIEDCGTLELSGKAKDNIIRDFGEMCINDPKNDELCEGGCLCSANGYEKNQKKMATKIDYKRSICDETRCYLIENFILPEYLKIRPGAFSRNGKTFYGIGNDKPKLSEDQKRVLLQGPLKGRIFVSKGRCTGFSSLMLMKIAADVVLAEKGEIDIMYFGWNQNQTKIFVKDLLELTDRIPEILWTEEEALFEKINIGTTSSFGGTADVYDVRKNEVDWEKGVVTFRNGVKLHFNTAKNVELKGMRTDKESKLHVYADEFFYFNYDTGYGTTWKTLDNKFKEMEKKNFVEYSLLGSSPKNTDSEAFDYIKERKENGEWVHMFPLDKESAIKTINQGPNENSKDEILGTIKKTEYLDSGESDWIKGDYRRKLS